MQKINARFPQLNIDQLQIGRCTQNTYAVILHDTKESIVCVKGSKFCNTAEANEELILKELNPHLVNLALNFARTIQSEYPEYMLTLTGHSLGGTICE